MKSGSTWGQQLQSPIYWCDVRPSTQIGELLAATLQHDAIHILDIATRSGSSSPQEHPLWAVGGPLLLDVLQDVNMAMLGTRLADRLPAAGMLRCSSSTACLPTYGG